MACPSEIGYISITSEIDWFSLEYSNDILHGQITWGHQNYNYFYWWKINEGIYEVGKWQKLYVIMQSLDTFYVTTFDPDIYKPISTHKEIR